MSIQNREIAYETMCQLLNKNYPEKKLTSQIQVHFIFIIKNASSRCQSLLTHQKIGLESAEMSSSMTLPADMQTQFVTPPAFTTDSKILAQWNHLQSAMMSFYNGCLEKGISHDDASLALPDAHAHMFRRQVSLNFRGMQEFLDESMCHKTYWELKEIAFQIYAHMKLEFPTLAKRLGAKCWENRNLYCDEPYDSYITCKCSHSRPHKSSLIDFFQRESCKASTDCRQKESYYHLT
ncbi:FAD-dependent thymidylate synthase [bacterium]|nr:FAD-dependent thymidylate synthase [bacterium]